VFPLEVSEAEDNVVGVGDGDAQALQEQAEKIGSPAEARLLGGVV